MPRKSQPLPRTRRAGAGTEFDAAYAAGLRLLQQRRFAEAFERLSDALRLKPADVAALSNFGLAASALGRFDEALAAFDGAIAEAPDRAEIHYNRGNAFRSQGRSADAVRSYDKALALEPAFAQAFGNRGAALQEMGRDEAALADYDQALAIDPRLAEALFNKAILLDRIGRSLDALAAFDGALSLKPGAAQGYVMRGQLLERLGRHGRALADFTQAARLDPDNAVAQTLRGDRLAALGRTEQALRCFEKAVEVDPRFAEAHDRAGMALVEIGRIGEARRAHERAVALSPGKAGFYYNLTAVAKLDADNPAFLAMTAMARDIGSLSPDDAIPLRFALAKAYMDQADYKAAFRHLREGNASRRAQIEYDERGTLADIETIRAIFTSKMLADHRGQGDPAASPVFVLGMPRSGSTLIEQILASHPKVDGAGEISDFSAAAVTIAGENLRDLRAGEDADAFRAKLRAIGAGYIDRIRARNADAERVVNKMPDNFRLAGLIHLALPNARIIHSRRDPVDTCLSIYSKLFSTDIAYAYDLGELGRYYRAYDALMAHWRAALPAHVFLEVSYEELVADPATHARRIVAHCGLDWDRRCLEFHRAARPVRTASAVQVRQPIYIDAVGRWTRFGADLAPLVAALGPSAPENAVMRTRVGGLLDRLRTVGGNLRRAWARPMQKTRVRRDME